MPPPEQLDQLHEMMKTLNKGNATHDEVVQLFATLSKAIKQIRVDLEAKIKDSGTKSTESHKKTLITLKATETRVGDSLKKTGEVSKASLDALKTQFLAELSAVKALIPKVPELPDFKGMLKEMESKIPTARDIDPKQIRDSLESLKGDNRLENYAVKDVPRITVSVSPPTNPQELDLWLKL